MTVRRRVLAATSVAVLSIAFASGCGSSSSTDRSNVPLSIELRDAQVTPGGTVVAVVRGCPAEGALPSSSPTIQLMLAPATGGNHWGPSWYDGEVEYGSTAMYVFGESSATAEPSSSGSTEFEVPVAADAESGTQLEASIVCGSLLALDASGQELDRTSVEAATATSNTVAVR